MPNWKEKIGDYGADCAFDGNGPLREDGVKELITFIETEIIEKLIEEIPDDYGVKLYPILTKQELRAKWLGK